MLPFYRDISIPDGIAMSLINALSELKKLKDTNPAEFQRIFNEFLSGIDMSLFGYYSLAEKVNIAIKYPLLAEMNETIYQTPPNEQITFISPTIKGLSESVNNDIISESVSLTII